MKHLEMHILQSVPVSCLNRDDAGSPKTAIFGGAMRSRISSQSYKRAIRMHAKDELPMFNGERTKLIVTPFKNHLVALGLEDTPALMEEANIACNALLTKNPKKNEKLEQVTTLLFMSPSEVKVFAEEYFKLRNINPTTSDDDGEDQENSQKKKGKKTLSPEAKIHANAQAASAILGKSKVRSDAADISLFGRMAANNPSMNVEAAAMFGHALSTHRSDNEPDFYIAVDDNKANDESGAAMMDTLEYSSACFYRYIALNLDLLCDEAHLAYLSPDERKAVVKTFVKSCLEAVPGARKNTMNANTRPGYVLLVMRDKGQPVQLVNAFEKPIYANGDGLMKRSIEALEMERASMEKLWGVDYQNVSLLSEDGLSVMLEKVANYVE